MRQKVKSLAELDLFLLNTLDPSPADVQRVESCYDLWKSSWEETFTKLNVDGGSHLYADDFLDREAIALFENETPVALFFNHTVTFTPSQLGHSYFKHYPKDIFPKLQELGFKRCMILSYMTVLPAFRKSATDIPMFELLFSLGVKRFQSRPQECLLGYIRKDLSFHESFARHGGIKLTQSHVYNVDVDYLYMTQDSAHLSPTPEVAHTAQHLWEKMLFRNKSAGSTKQKQAA